MNGIAENKNLTLFVWSGNDDTGGRQPGHREKGDVTHDATRAGFTRAV
jgi:hypothetical protein